MRSHVAQDTSPLERLSTRQCFVGLRLACTLPRLFAVAVRERVNDGVEDFRVAQVQLVQDRERVGVQAGDCLNANRGGLPRADIPVPTVGLSSSPYRRRA